MREDRLVDPLERLRDICLGLLDAYRVIAPRRLVAELDARGG
jgi:hypothetical protein